MLIDLIGQLRCLTICKCLTLICILSLCLIFTQNIYYPKKEQSKYTSSSKTGKTASKSESISTSTTTAGKGSNDMLQRYKAAMVLSGAGDAIGYNRGRWEFCKDGLQIHEELKKMGGLNKINVAEQTEGNRYKWLVSDDTVMHLATAEALYENGDLEKTLRNIGDNYKKCMQDMSGRAPGPTSMTGAQIWNPNSEKRRVLAFDPRGGGCGAAMRAMCIGLRYPRVEDENNLIAISIESGRMSHHHPTGYLGALASALFTAYSVRGKELKEWGHGLMEMLPRALKYVQEAGHSVKENELAWNENKSFGDRWRNYLRDRKILDGKSEPVFPENYDVKQRDEFYRSVSYSGWGGASGHDAPLIAYDSILFAKDDWTELANRAFFHGGDSDSTAVMAACWFGALYGYKGVPESNYKGLEYQSRLEKAGEILYKLSHPEPAAAPDSQLSYPEPMETPDSLSSQPKTAESQDSQSEPVKEPESQLSQPESAAKPDSQSEPVKGSQL
ncbi:ADP-ribosylhydrolase ARH1 isoform X2 [Patella vulgata]|uniref:ADP-ribosylhydrolase ARH1 isoform X2 n=1 Tax=Patella vulgata TaxID=6465 RepID=UPI0024A876F7|nr:ADP-ribosylhydrolase ARH1 isoform X2 [Patella vulgata]XP_055954706.1 ADP-ribosylhydrolase ARH1 isoform X2 [Patella vulgata]